MEGEKLKEERSRTQLWRLLAYLGLTAFMIILSSVVSYHSVLSKYGPEASAEGVEVVTEEIAKSKCRVNGKCPEIPCVPLKCIPNPHCVPRPWPRNYNQCPTREKCDETSTCSERKCPEQNRDRSGNKLEHFKNSFIERKTVFEWLDMYPPNSEERLYVVTTLLEQVIDKWAMAGQIHRCASGYHRPFNFETNFLSRDLVFTNRDTTVCSICKERYHYINCVMGEELVNGSSVRLQTPDESFLRDAVSAKMAASVLAHNTWNGLKLKGRPENKHPYTVFLGKYIEKMAAVRNAYEVWTASGRKCSPCTGLTEWMYNRCISCEDFVEQYLQRSERNHACRNVLENSW